MRSGAALCVPKAVYLVVRERGHAGPRLLGGGAKDPKYPEELIDLRVPREERTAVCKAPTKRVVSEGWLAGSSNGGVVITDSRRDHLGKDASDGPEVDGAGVLARPEENLRCPIPQRHHLMLRAT